MSSPATVCAQPLVTVVIPAFDASNHLRECLYSVLAQAVSVPVEIIVVDDASTDDTAEVAASCPNVRLLRLAANAGPSRARNAGIEAARGELVAFLDADDMWPEGSLAARLAVLERHPDAALVFGDCRQFDRRGPWERTQFAAGSLGAQAWGTSGLIPDAYTRLLVDNFITTGSVLARKAAVIEVGGFAENLRLVEDLDLWLRLARQYVIAWCDDVSLLRRRHEANTSRDAVAMSLAYLEVLHRQATLGPRPDHRLLRLISRLAAREQLHLADLATRRNEPDEALRWAMRSMSTCPSIRALWRTGQTALRCLCPRPAKRDRA